MNDISITRQGLAIDGATVIPGRLLLADEVTVTRRETGISRATVTIITGGNITLDVD